MPRERTTDFIDALQNNKEYWAPIPAGTKVFDVTNKDGRLVRICGILDDTKTSGDFLGCLVEGFEERHTDLIHLDPSIIKDALKHKRYVVVDRSARFVPPT